MTSAVQQQHDILLESGTNELEILVFCLQNQRYGVNVAKVREVINPLAVTPLPESHKTVLGMFQLRDTVTPLIDLHLSLGMKEIDANSGKIIIMEFNDNRVGFLVDEVEQIYRISWETVASIPDVDGIRDAPITSIAHINDQMVLMLDFEKIVFDIGGVDLFEENASKIKDNATRGDQRILLAEDSNLMRQLIGGNLKQAGYNNIQICNDGKEAWDTLMLAVDQNSDAGFDLIITDIEMPRIDGLHLTKKIRGHAKLKDVPVIIFSSLVSADNQKKCDAVGANAQITKPQLDKLVELLDGLLGLAPTS